MSVIFSLKNISAGYGDQEVITGVSKEIRRGTLTCLIGPNGCGKSTLIKAMSGTVPYSGSLELVGREVSSMPRREFGRIVGVLPQQASVSSSFTVYEVISLGRMPHHGIFSRLTAEDDKKIYEAAEAAGAEHLLFREAASLSGGERQRAMFAMILAQEPEVFLLDEPTSALDPRYARMILSLLRKMALQGSTVIAAIHDINAALAYADQFIAIKDGRFLAEGPTAEIDEKTLEALYEVPFAPYFSERGDAIWYTKK